MYTRGLAGLSSRRAVQRARGKEKQRVGRTETVRAIEKEKKGRGKG